MQKNRHRSEKILSGHQQINSQTRHILKETQAVAVSEQSSSKFVNSTVLQGIYAKKVFRIRRDIPLGLPPQLLSCKAKISFAAFISC